MTGFHNCWDHIAILTIVLTLVSCQIETANDIVIYNTSVIDLETGTISNNDVVINDSIITQISQSGSVSRNANEVLDGSGYYLIPGLWDMHVHIQDSNYFSMFLDHGITGVRDMGGCVRVPTDGCESVCPDILTRWKTAISEGNISGPQLFIAGTQLSGTGWPTSFPVSNRQEVAYAFRQNLSHDVDFIKVYEDIPWDSYKEIARLAKLNDLNFVGHVSEPFLLSDILDLGQKSIEHLREPIVYSFTSDSNELDSFMIADNYTPEGREYVQPWIDDAENVIEAFKRNQAWFTPTMAVEYARQRYNDTSWINHPLRRELPRTVTDGMHAHLDAMRLSGDKKGDSLWWMALGRLIKRFNKENIGMLAGSDSACEGGIPGYSLHEELFFMVEEAGLSPLEALQTATVNPCVFFELKNQGKVREGYHADLILLEENPLENIRNTLSIKAVIRNGEVVRPAGH